MVIFFSDIMFQAIPSELQEAAPLRGYIFPDISTHVNSLLQEQSFQTLRKHAVVTFKNVLMRTIAFIVSCP